MSEQPKPQPPTTRQPFDYTLLGMFTMVICDCGWMIAGYGVSRGTLLWEGHADVEGCACWQMVVGS